MTVKEDIDTSKDLFVISIGNLGPKHNHFRIRSGQVWCISRFDVKIKDMDDNIIREEQAAKDCSGTAFW